MKSELILRKIEDEAEKAMILMKRNPEMELYFLSQRAVLISLISWIKNRQAEEFADITEGKTTF